MKVSNEDLIFPVGKKKGKKINECEDYSYLCHIWHYKYNFSDEVLTAIRDRISQLIEERWIRDGYAKRDENGEIILTTPEQLQKEAEEEIEENLLRRWNCF